MEEDKKIQEASLEEEKEEIENNKKIKSRKKFLDAKTKNLISVIILLIGLFLGSLYVDLAQMFSGKGVSQKIINGSDVFSLNGRTWVAYENPIVELSVINDENCENCDPSEALVGIKRVIPTVSVKKIAYDSEEGKKMIEKFSLKSVPAFVFSREVAETDFYTQAQSLFTEKDGQYIFNISQVGLPVGKYITLPEIKDDSIKVGSQDAKVKLIVFSDFQCPYSKAFNDIMKKVLSEYSDKIVYSYRNLPLESIHPRAMDAALAARCANDQGKFLDYSNKLFDNQKAWSANQGNQIFKTYANQFGLNAGDFAKCLDEKKYEESIKNDLAEANEFGISGTPGIFINDQFKGGVVDFDSLKKIIDEQLAK